jgi:competence protein ComEA
MNDGFLSDSVVSFLRSNLLLVGTAITGVILLGYGYFMMQPVEKEDTVVFEAASGSVPQMNSQGNDDQTIFVDIAGAVEKPGVYEVASDARVQDVLTRAGGLAKKADKQGIAKSVNLAAKVSDGMKLYFPFVGEAAVMGVSTTSSTRTTNTTGLININSASQTELESLPGIGEVTAEKIINGRPYTTAEDLKTKKIVGTSVYDKIKDSVTANE